MSTIAERYARVESQVRAAAERSGRDPSEVTLIAVSKTHPVEAVREAYEAGARIFGENYVQELVAKAQALPEAQWHFIGHLQTNKAKKVVGVVSLIHSVDRPKLARALSKRSVAMGIVSDVLIEVNIGGEASKSGVSPDETLHLAEEIAALPGLRLRGLMAIPQAVATAEEARPAFRAMSALLKTLRDAECGGALLDILSMGMSHDFEVAIAEGATHVRVGTAIFGPRPPKAP